MGKSAFVNRNEFQLLGGFYAIPEKLISVFFIVWISLSTPTWLAIGSRYAIQNLKGDWADTALSDILSERYDCPVKVSKVRFLSWSEIHFADISIRSREGRDLIYGSHGSFTLKQMRLKHDPLFETEIVLSDVYFTREYYKSSPALKKWGYLMRKPIAVKQLKLRVIQDPEFTRLKIIDCKSDVLALEGGLVIDKSGKIEDKVKVSYNTWALLRNAI
jgi:hypothetical protein